MSIGSAEVVPAEAGPAEQEQVTETPRPAIETIVSDIRRRILVGEIPVGSWLRHGQLADEYGISRTPVREALRVLHSEGTVAIVPNRGAQVVGQSSEELRELARVRGALEGLAASLAAENANDEQVARMFEHLAVFEKFSEHGYAIDADEYEQEWVHANAGFHGVILESANNGQLTTHVELIHRRLPSNSSYAAYRLSARLRRRNFQQHDQVARAIRDGKAEEARRAMTEHILSSVDDTLRTRSGQ